MKKVIYTAIFNNYDSVKRPKYVNEDYDYRLFVDEETYISQHKNIKDSIYKTTILTDVTDGFMKAKDIKINPEKYLPNYDSSIYVDGSFQQIGDVNNFLNQTKRSYKMCNHPNRVCIYEEAKVCINQRVDSPERIKAQIDRYKTDGFPANYGLIMGGIIARVHNKKSKRINYAWWNEIVNGSRRDQLSMNYVLWKLNEKVGVSDYDGSVDSVFRIANHLK